MLRSSWMLRTVLAAAVGIASVGAARADLVINRFDDEFEIFDWFQNFGGAVTTLEWDGTMDADNNANSGSLKMTINFDAALEGENKTGVARNLNGSQNYNGATGVRFTYFVDPESPSTPWGDKGYGSFVARTTPGWNWTPQWNDNINAFDWFPVETTEISGDLSDTRAFTWQHYGGPAQNLTGTAIVWLDNIELIGNFALKGDMNNDSLVDNDDINFFVQGLLDFDAYQAAAGVTDGLYRGDVNSDNAYDNDDIGGFVTLLLGGGAAAVPEPSTWVLAALGLASAAFIRRRY
jgi:PEP-CTERM motif